MGAIVSSLLKDLTAAGTVGAFKVLDHCAVLRIGPTTFYVARRFGSDRVTGLRSRGWSGSHVASLSSAGVVDVGRALDIAKAERWVAALESVEAA